MSFGITLRIMSYNRPDYLKQALDSAFDQTVPFHSIEVYDNGSRPEALRFLERYGRGVKVRSFPKNSKTTWESAFGDSCQSRHLCVFHDDDLFGSKFVEVTLANLNQMPSLIAHSCNGRRINSDGPFEHLLLLDLQRSLRFTNPVAMAEHCLNSCIPWAPTTYVWNRQLGETYRAAQKHGRLDDVGMLFALLQKGEIYLEKEPLYDCRIHAENGSRNLGWLEENQLWSLFLEVCPENDPRWAVIRRNLQKRYTDRWFHDWLRGSGELPPLRWSKLSLLGLHRCCRNNKIKILRRLVLGPS